MAVTPINSEDRLVQKTFAEHLERVLGWESVYAWNRETFGPDGTLGRACTKDAVLTRDLRAALERLNPDLPESAIEDAMRALTVYDVSRSTVQHNRDFYRLLRGGVPVTYRDAHGRQKTARARVIDFDNGPGSNRFLAVRELKLTGIRTPNYNRRADLVCFINGLPLVFIELKAVHKNIREGFDNNLSDYMDENVIAHAFHHNAFLIVSNGDHARFGSITSEWEHFAEWKRLDETDKGSLDAERLLNGMLAHERLLDCQSAFNIDPRSACKIDPLGGTAEVVPVANRGTRAASCSALRYAKRSRVGGPCWPTGATGPQGCWASDQDRFLKRQLSFPVSMISQWWVSRSSRAVVILGSPKTDGHSPKARFVVMTVEVLS